MGLFSLTDEDRAITSLFFLAFAPVEDCDLPFRPLYIDDCKDLYAVPVESHTSRFIILDLPRAIQIAVDSLPEAIGIYQERS